MFGNKSERATTIIIFFVLTMVNVRSECGERQHNEEEIITFPETEIPNNRKNPKIVPMPSESLAIETISGESFEIGTRYSIDAPPVRLIECKPNEKFQEGTCKQQSNLWYWTIKCIQFIFLA